MASYQNLRPKFTLWNCGWFKILLCECFCQRRYSQTIPRATKLLMAFGNDPVASEGLRSRQKFQFRPVFLKIPSFPNWDQQTRRNLQLSISKCLKSYKTLSWHIIRTFSRLQLAISYREVLPKLLLRHEMTSFWSMCIRMHSPPICYNLKELACSITYLFGHVDHVYTEVHASHAQTSNEPTANDCNISSMAGCDGTTTAQRYTQMYVQHANDKMKNSEGK